MIRKEEVMPLLLEACPSFRESPRRDPERFREHLGPESTKWWDELNRFWDGKSPYVGSGLKKSEPSGSDGA